MYISLIMYLLTAMSIDIKNKLPATPIKIKFKFNQTEIQKNNLVKKKAIRFGQGKNHSKMAELRLCTHVNSSKQIAYVHMEA